MGNMRFKVGDRVRIKSVDWYNENKDKDGNIFFPLSTMTKAKSEWCGKVMTILSAHVDFYRMEEMGLTAINYWTDEMIEGLVEESVNIDVAVEETTKDISDKVVDTIMGGLMVGKSFNLPEGYQFVDENGNVINAQKIVLEKKKKEYPKTYKECYRIMNIDTGFLVTSYDLDFWKGDLLTSLQKLLVCRDAYWKIAGEEMRLCKPWEPDYTEKTVKYCLRTNYGRIVQTRTSHDNHPFSFPTEEMRDAFYENFKELIESCKELL